MAYGESNGHVTNRVTWPRKVKLVTPNSLRAQYLENNWICYLATITNYYTVFRKKTPTHIFVHISMCDV